MDTVGIIAEFNPFHKGHEYLLSEAKKKTGAKYVIVVMSGSFVQRGEAALFDKWTRAKCALLNGADMVLELPVLFSAANAETFAKGSIRVLENTGMVDSLCFGSESGDLASLQEAAKCMVHETKEFQHLLKSYLSQGISYPAARAKAVETVSHINKDILSQPNHILALEYLKALEQFGSTLRPYTVKRQGSGFHNPTLATKFASATAIRKAILENKVKEASLYIPENTVDLLTKELSLGTGPVTLSGLTDILHYKLRTISQEHLHEMEEVTEGLENRILRSVEQCYALDDLIDFIKSKRYTRTKIQRILVHILLDIRKENVSHFLQKIHLPYIRVLGFRKDSAEILGELTKRAKCPVLTNLKKAAEQLDKEGMELLSLEKTATDLYTLASPNPLYRAPNRDFTTPMAIL